MVRVTSFGVGVEWGSNAWVDTLDDCLIFGNGVGVSAAAGAGNSAEENRVVGSDIFNNAGPGVADASTADLMFLGTSFDYNGGPAIVSTDFQCFGCHFEGSAAPLVDDSEGGAVRVFGGMATVTGTGGSAPGIFLVGPSSRSTVVEGIFAYSLEQTGALVDGDAGGPVTILGVAGNRNGTIRRLAGSRVGQPTEFADAGFEPGAGDAGGQLVAGSIALGPGGTVVISAAGGSLLFSGPGGSGWSIGPQGVLGGGPALLLAGSSGALTTTSQTGNGDLVMSNSPAIVTPALTDPSVGGGQPVPRMIYAGRRVQLAGLPPRSCRAFSIAAPGSVAGDVAIASPTEPPLGLRRLRRPGGGMTWSARVPADGRVSVEVCNPAGTAGADTDDYWGAWVIGGYQPAAAAPAPRALR